MTTPSREQRIESILHAYLQAIDRGEKPDRQALLDANPELQVELAEYFADASKLERMAKSLKTASFSPANRAQPAFKAPTPAELADKFPQFEIVELLGQGGMGAVYKARQKGLDRFIALKILPSDAGRDVSFAERFLREAKALARLSHPNIVAVYDVGQTPDGLGYFVMEFIDGVNLRQAMRTGTMSPKEALAIVPQICDALQFAHDEGIVHRDIKPENVLLDRKGRVKIADFGLAKLLGTSDLDASLTGTHQVMGTLRYMAPEQMEGSKTIDHRADIYSLGVVFYELLTGELPMGRFAPPSKKVQIDVRLDEVVLRALEREPEQRWQQASDVKTEMEAISRAPQSPIPIAMDRPQAALAEASKPTDSSHSLSLPLVIAGWAMMITLIAIAAWFLPNATHTTNHKMAKFAPKSGAVAQVALGGKFQSRDWNGTVAEIRPTQWELEIEVTPKGSNSVSRRQIGLPIPRQIKYELGWIIGKGPGRDDNPLVRAETARLQSFIEGSFNTADKLPASWDEFRERAEVALQNEFRYEGVDTAPSVTEEVKPFWPVLGIGATIVSVLLSLILLLRKRDDGGQIFGGFRIVAAGFLLILHVAAFLLPTVARNGRSYLGWEWVGSAGESMPASLNANLFFWVGLVLFASGFWRWTIALGFTALMLAAADFVPRDTTTRYQVGALMWFCSLALLPAVAVFAWHKFGQARPWQVVGVVFVLSLALLIRHNLHYYEGPPDPAPFQAIGVVALLNLGLVIWAITHSIRAWLQADLLPERRVRGPAKGLVLVGILGAVIDLIFFIVFTALFIEKYLAPQGSEISSAHLAAMFGALAMLALRVFIMIAGFRLLELQGRSRGLIAGGLALLPFDPAAIVAIPVGVWTLLVLLRDDVTQSMAMQRTGGSATSASSPTFRQVVTWPLRNTASRTAIWSLLCVGLYVWLWIPNYPANSGRYGPHPIGLIDRQYWPYRGELQATVTLIPREKTFRQLTITNERKIERHGWDNGLSYWWGGPGSRGERTLDNYTIELIDRNGQKGTSVLEIDGVKALEWRFGSGDKTRRGTTPFNVEDALDWLKECNVVSDDEKAFRAQTKNWVEIVLHASAHSGNVMIWKGPRQPVGHLAYIVGQDLSSFGSGIERARVNGQPPPSFPWEDYLGTETIHYGPVVPILYVGVPIMLAVWLIGLIAFHLLSREKSATSLRTWAEWWRNLPGGVRLMVHLPLTLVYLLCVWCFFGYSGSSSTAPGDPAKSSHHFAIGQPSPWFERHSEAERSSTSIHFLAWSNLAALLGLLALGAMRRLEYLERGKVHSIRWHYGLWIFMLLLAAGIGVFSSIMHHKKLHELTAKQQADGGSIILR